MSMFNQFWQKHRQRIMKIIPALFMVVLVVVAAIQIQRLDLKEYEQTFLSLTLTHKILVMMLGFFSFLACTIYDFILCKSFHLHFKKMQVLQMSIIAQAFNNFISFSGSTGAKFRLDMLKHNPFANTTTVFKISFSVLVSQILGAATFIIPALLFLPQHISTAWSLLGLVGLYVPFYFLIDHVKFKSKIARYINHLPFYNLTLAIKLKLWWGSLLDWTMGGLFFAFCTYLLIPQAPVLTSFSVFIVAQTVGILTFIPSGLGSFDLTAIFLLHQLGFPTHHGVLTILLFRIGYHLGPVLIAIILYISHFLHTFIRKIVA